MPAPKKTNTEAARAALAEKRARDAEAKHAATVAAVLENDDALALMASIMRTRAERISREIADLMKERQDINAWLDEHAPEQLALEQ